MKNKIKPKIVNGTFGKMKLIDDFLPPPEELVFKKSTVKVTITLQKDSIDFFKKEAQRLNTSYQGMIRNLLREYAQRMKNKIESSEKVSVKKQKEKILRAPAHLR